MAVEKIKLERVFIYGKRKLSDPCPDMEPKEVLKLYSNTFPELTNSSVSGPVFKDDKMIYEFKTSIGTKG